MPMLDQVSEMPMPSRPYIAASDSAEVTTNQSTRYTSVSIACCA